MGAEISVDDAVYVSVDVVNSWRSFGQTRSSVIDDLCGDNDSNDDSAGSVQNIVIDAKSAVPTGSAGKGVNGGVSNGNPHGGPNGNPHGSHSGHGSGLCGGTCPHTFADAMAKNTRSIADDFKSNKYSPHQMIANIKSDFDNFCLPSDLTTESKICFICCNSYEGSRYALGESALNDGLLAYINFQRLGYDVYIFHDMNKGGYMDVFTQFLQAEVSKVVIYYIGHGTNTRDTSGDEADGFDECLFFTDGVIIDDDLCITITDNKANCSKLILLSDCCHSGTIYDVPDRKDILSISAAADNETAKQDWIEKKGQGIFTYYFWKYYTDDIELQALETAMNRHLKKYRQSFVTNKGKKAIRGLL